MRAAVSDLVEILAIGLFVAGTMWLVKRQHEVNQRQRDDVAHLDDAAHP